MVLQCNAGEEVAALFFKKPLEEFLSKGFFVFSAKGKAEVENLNGCIKCFNLWYSKAFWRFMDKEHKLFC